MQTRSKYTHGKYHMLTIMHSACVYEALRLFLFAHTKRFFTRLETVCVLPAIASQFNFYAVLQRLWCIGIIDCPGIYPNIQDMFNMATLHNIAGYTFVNADALKTIIFMLLIGKPLFSSALLENHCFYVFITKESSLCGLWTITER